MRLRTLLIEKYGNLDRAELSFDPVPGRLNLLVAPNGAGKSVLREAFHDLLFGIPRESGMKFRFDYPGMHLRADAVSAEGVDFTFGWQRKAGRVFPNAGSDPAASRWLAELLAAVTPSQVQMLFALDTARLRSGGKELAEGDGTVGSALLSGTGELASARALRRSLNSRRDAIWERAKSSRPLNTTLSRLAAAAKQRRDSTQTPRLLADMQAKLAQTLATREAAAAASVAAQKALSRLNRIELTRGPLAVLAEAEAWLAEHGDAAPSLPAGLGDNLAQAQLEASLAATGLEATDARLKAAETRLAETGRDTEADAAGAHLAKLSGVKGDAAVKVRDSANLRVERADALREVSAALRDIGSSAAPEQAGSANPSLAATAAAREQISRYNLLANTLGTAQTRRESARAALAVLQSEAATAPAAAPAGLDLLLAAIRRDRDPIGHAAELAREVRRATADEDACAARLSGWTGTARDLAGLAPATAAAYERLDSTLATARGELAAATRERGRQQDERTAWQDALAALRQQTLPDDQALAAARSARDRGWQLIHARAFGTAPDLAGEREYGGGDAVALVFERHLRAADAVADARIVETARVEQAARLAADLLKSEPAWQSATGRVTELTRAVLEAADQWTAACRPLGLAPDAALRDVTTLLDARERVIEARRASELATGEVAALADVHARWAEGLAQALDVPTGPLAAILPLADARLQGARQAEAAALKRDALRGKAVTDMAAAEAEAIQAETDLTGWQAGWDVLLRGLGRPTGESPAVTGHVLSRLAELDRHHRNAESLHGRIEGMQADIAAFAGTVDDLARRLAVPAGADPFRTADLLIARRDRALALASAAGEVQRAHAEASEAADKAAARNRDANAKLAALLTLCGAVDAVEAGKRIEAARRRHDYEETRKQAQARLRDVGGGLTRATLEAELAALPREQFETERAAADAALTASRKAEQEAAVMVAELDRRYAADAAATEASEAAEAEATAAAEAGRLLDEYVLLRVASGLLGTALQRVEDNAGPTGAQRIAAAFERVTNGAWSVRTSENSKGEMLLMAYEPGSTDAAKQIDQLSEGTRDQLYLALRLVAIEAHVAVAPPLPFIADDVLQTFDDTRARAAMEALVTLSGHVQVIVLTHHPHLLAVANGLPIHVQRL